MAYIKVDINKLEVLEDIFSKTYSCIGTVKNTVEGVRENLDWRVSIQDEINSTLKNIAKDLEDTKNSFDGFKEFIVFASQEYSNAESMTAEEIRAANLQKANAAYAEAARIQKENAVNKAIATDDPAMNYLKSIRNKNEELGIQIASYAYTIASFDFQGIGEKIIPDSKEVDKLRKNAMQNAVASVICSNIETNDNSTIEEIDTVISLFVDESGLLGDVYDEATGSESGAGTKVAVAKFLWDTGIDFHEYNSWNKAQKQLFSENLSPIVQTRQLLEDIMAAYPNDDLLVSYCEESIQEIDSQKNDIIKNIWDNAAGYSGIVLENAAISGGTFVANKFLGKCLGTNLVTMTGQAMGLATEAFAGTKTTNNTLEYIDILHTDIEESASDYASVANNANVSEDVKRFHQLYMINMKIEGLELSKNMNKVLFEQRNSEFVDDVDGMISSYQKAYETILSSS